MHIRNSLVFHHQLNLQRVKTILGISRSGMQQPNAGSTIKGRIRLKAVCPCMCKLQFALAQNLLMCTHPNELEHTGDIILYMWLTLTMFCITAAHGESWQHVLEKKCELPTECAMHSVVTFICQDCWLWLYSIYTVTHKKLSRYISAHILWILMADSLITRWRKDLSIFACVMCGTSDRLMLWVFYSWFTNVLCIVIVLWQRWGLFAVAQCYQKWEMTGYYANWPGQ